MVHAKRNRGALTRARNTYGEDKTNWQYLTPYPRSMTWSGGTKAT